jgi:hypothetical protein
VLLLSRPKPVRLEWRDAADAHRLGALPVENQAIYVWLVMPDSPEPRAYALPWSVQAAQQLQDAQSEAAVNGAGLRMTMPLEAGPDDRAPLFYAMPQPALPPKDQQDGPLVYRQPAPL